MRFEITPVIIDPGPEPSSIEEAAQMLGAAYDGAKDVPDTWVMIRAKAQGYARHLNRLGALEPYPLAGGDELHVANAAAQIMRLSRLTSFR